MDKDKPQFTNIEARIRDLETSNNALNQRVSQLEDRQTLHASQIENLVEWESESRQGLKGVLDEISVLKRKTQSMSFTDRFMLVLACILTSTFLYIILSVLRIFGLA